MSADDDRVSSLPVRVLLFGHDAGDGAVRVLERSRRWRAVGAATFAGVGILLAPLAALVPPHAPWAAAALLGGLLLGRRRWLERHTLLEVEAECPRCGKALRLPSPTRLRSPLGLHCERCHHQPSIVVEAEDAHRG